MQRLRFATLPLCAALLFACGDDTYEDTTDVTATPDAPPSLCRYIEDPTPGGCLLEYNENYEPDEALACCYELGGSNDCDLSRACPDGDCSTCLIYAGAAAGGGCCHYTNGDDPNTSNLEKCAALLESMSSAGLTCN